MHYKKFLLINPLQTVRPRGANCHLPDEHAESAPHVAYIRDQFPLLASNDRDYLPTYLFDRYPAAALRLELLILQAIPICYNKK